MKPIQLLARQTVGYGASNMLARFINYFLVPFYTLVLPTPAEYGMLTEWYSYVAICNILYLYGMETAYFRFAAQERFGEQKVFSQTLGLILCSTFLWSALLIVFRTHWAAACGYAEKPQFVVWIACIMAADALLAIPLARWRHMRRVKHFAYLKVGNVVLNVLLNLFFMLLCKHLYDNHHELARRFYRPDWNIEYIFLSNLVANAGVLPFVLPTLLTFRPVLDRNLVFRLLRFALPLLGMGLLGAAMEYMPRVMYKHLAVSGVRENLQDLGVFAACAKLSVFMLLLIQAFRYAFDPFIFSFSPQEARKILPRSLMWFVLVGASIFVFVSLFSSELATLFLRKKAYHEGLQVVPYLLMGYLFSGVYYHVSAWFKITQQTHYGLYFSLLGWTLTLVGNLLLVPRIGYMGIAYTFLLTYLLMATVNYGFGQRFFPVSYRPSKLLGYLALSILTVWMGSTIAATNLLPRVGVLFLYICVLYLLEGRPYVKDFMLFFRREKDKPD